MTDAIGLLALGDFVSFMSGNTTRLAVAISDADLALVLRLSAAVLSFVIGNALGVLLGARVPPSGLAGAAGGRRPAGLCSRMALGSDLARAARRHTGHGHDQRRGRTGERPAHRPDLRYRRPVTASVVGWGAGCWASGAMAGGCNWCLGPACCWAPRWVPGCSTTWGLQALAGSCSLACVLALVSRFIPRTWQRGYMPH
ncbi:hypothetical protein PPS11_37125 [Pseudomonas putida S11]|nr:hypothetical protein PPS11_37125 [Pseudomonas putida S11]